MKNLFIITICFMLISCGKEEIEEPIVFNPETVIEDCREVDYGEEFTLSFAESVCFPNSNLIAFKNAEPHFCPCFIQCDLASDVFITLYTINSEGIAVTHDDKTFYLQNATSDYEILDFYKISSFSYTYGSDDEDIPICEDDFEKEKLKLHLTIEKKQ